MAEIGDSGDLTAALGPAGTGGTGELAAGEAVAGQMLGVYGEIAYDLMPLLFPDSEKTLEPFFRYSYYDTQRDVPSGFSTRQEPRRSRPTLSAFPSSRFRESSSRPIIETAAQNRASCPMNSTWGSVLFSRPAAVVVPLLAVFAAVNARGESLLLPE